MVASAANQFGQILFDPNGTTCDAATHNIPYDFHPMYATSSEHTRVPWAAHSYNVAFSDEIRHFEYCSSVDAEGGNCTSSGTSDPPSVDDAFCFDAAFAVALGLVPIGGCIDSDVDFDGVPYRNVWPGSLADRSLDRVLHAQPVIFESPVFRDGRGEARDYNRIAFEADLPRIETNTTPPCQRHISNPADPQPGAGCVNPPRGRRLLSDLHDPERRGRSLSMAVGRPVFGGDHPIFWRHLGRGVRPLTRTGLPSG
jgi:hypothetical protein